MTILKERKVWKAERKPRKPNLYNLERLDTEQEAHVRRALGVLRIRFRSLDALAEALKAQPRTVARHIRQGGHPTAGIALRVAALANVLVDDVLSGKFPAEGSCPYCGRTR